MDVRAYLDGVGEEVFCGSRRASRLWCPNNAKSVIMYHLAMDRANCGSEKDQFGMNG